MQSAVSRDDWCGTECKRHHYILCTFSTGLLSGFDSKWFDCIFATVKTTESAKTNNVDDEFSIATWTRRFGTAIQSSILQRDNASVSENRMKLYPRRCLQRTNFEIRYILWPLTWLKLLGATRTNLEVNKKCPFHSRNSSAGEIGIVPRTCAL